MIDFLDVTVSIMNEDIHTTIYTKPTNRHMYLHHSSNYPQTMKKANPYELGIRAKCISSTEGEYNTHMTHIINNLKTRGHSCNQVENVMKKAEVTYYNTEIKITINKQGYN